MFWPPHDPLRHFAFFLFVRKTDGLIKTVEIDSPPLRRGGNVRTVKWKLVNSQYESWHDAQRQCLGSKKIGLGGHAPGDTWFLCVELEIETFGM